MAKINFGNKKLKIFAATMVTIFSLLVVFVGSIAWFSTITSVSNDGNHINVDVVGKFYKISYHQYTGSPTATAWSFNKTPEAYVTYDWANHRFNTPKNGSNQDINSFSLSMNQYDPMSKNKPILVLIELREQYNTAIQGEVYVNGITETAGFLGAKDIDPVSGANLPRYKLDGTSPNLRIDRINRVDYYPLSSVVSFRARGFNTNEYNTWSAESTYNLSTSDTSAPTDYNFTEVDRDADTSSFHQKCNFYSSGSSASVHYIAIVVDYNDSAIEYIYSTYLGDTTLESNGYILNYLCDWKWEII